MNSAVVGSWEEGQKGRMCVTNSFSLQQLSLWRDKGDVAVSAWNSVPGSSLARFFQDSVVLSLEDK